MLLEGTEFLSIWKVAHRWVGYDPDSTDPNDLPQNVREFIQLLIVGHNRGDLPLRTKNGYCFDRKDDSFLNIMTGIPIMIKLWECHSRNVFDKEFLDSVRVARGELLRYCQKEFRAPPSFWMPEELKPQNVAVEQAPNNEEEDNDTGWYENLTERRKQRVAALEVAKKLWAINPNRTYEEVLQHPDMELYGNPRNFSLKSFKNWARPFASEYAKSGGKQKESNK